MIYLLQHALMELVLPPFSPFLLLLLGALVAKRWRRSGNALMAMAVAAMLLGSLSGLHILGNVQQGEPPLYPNPPYPEAEAIVVLGGGRYFDALEYGGDTAGPSTLERVRYAAKLYRETGKPVLVSGGRPGDRGSRSEADIMANILEHEFNVPVRWRDDRASNTAENAEFSVPLLEQDGIQTIYLVTHSAHMSRASATFEREGLSVVPMATGYIEPEQLTPLSWVPSYHGIALTRYWLYEKIAGWVL